MSFGQGVIYTQGTAWVECDKCGHRESRHMTDVTASWDRASR